MITTDAREHYIAVMSLLNADPLSDRAAQLRIAIIDMEQRDPTLIKRHLDIMAAHVRQVGERKLADRVPAGVMLT